MVFPLKLNSFGRHERNMTENEKEQIMQTLKGIQQTYAKDQNIMLNADYNYIYFKRLGYISGSFMFGLMFFLPVMKRTNLVFRIGFAGLNGYLSYNIFENIGEESRWA